MAASAAFTVEDVASAGNPTTATASQTINLALSSLVDVRSVSWSVYGSSDPNVTSPTITPAGSPSGVTASFTMPTPDDADLGYSLIVKCIVNGGVNGGVVDAALTATALVGVVNVQGDIPMAAGETFERDLTHGWVPFFNAVLARVPS